MIYTASNRSLAMAEVLVHFSPAITPSQYVMMTLSIPDRIPIVELAIGNCLMAGAIFRTLLRHN